MNENISLFDGHIPYYKIDKPIRLIELFAGIGSQFQALKNLGSTVEHYKICEWQVNSIQAYNDIHVGNYTDNTNGLTKEELVSRLSHYGVSIDYNSPVKFETLNRKPIEWLRQVYNNIINTNNLVNIMSVKGKDLEIKDKDKYEYILTYSFPCQDLSKAGKGKGMTDNLTRSGLLWEVERILSECDELPQILLMENVPDVIGSRYINDFRRWEERLSELGYSNHIAILNAKDFGIPQNRERAFMVSLLGNYQYNFPQKQELKLRLKDMLEQKVDEKYYLSNNIINFFKEHTKKQKALGNGFKFEPRKEDDVAKTITTRNGSRPDDNFVDETKEYANYITWKDDKGRLNTQDHRAYFEDRLSGTVPAMERGIPNVILTEPRLDIVANIQENGRENGNIYNSYGLSPTLLARDYKDPKKITEPSIVKEDIVIYDDYNSSIRNDQNTIGTLTTNIGNDAPRNGYKLIENQLRIRKLTPRECYRLMGFSDEAFDKAQANQSNSSLYHQAGDSIVVNVLEAIFKQLF